MTHLYSGVFIHFFSLSSFAFHIIKSHFRLNVVHSAVKLFFECISLLPLFHFHLLISIWEVESCVVLKTIFATQIPLTRVYAHVFVRLSRCVNVKSKMKRDGDTSATTTIVALSPTMLQCTSKMLVIIMATYLVCFIDFRVFQTEWELWFFMSLSICLSLYPTFYVYSVFKWSNSIA